MTNEQWDQRYLAIARHVSSWSKDPNKKVGAVVTDDLYVRGLGYNGFPKGLDDQESLLQDKELKLQLMVHAEINAILAAQRQGDTIYIWPQLPCPQCAGFLVQAGITRVVVPVDCLHVTTSWNVSAALLVLQQGDVEVNYV